MKQSERYFSTNPDRLIIGIGDIKASDKKCAELVTHALGSCVAVMVYDRLSESGGMVHIALPDSSNKNPGSVRPEGYYVDTALPALIKSMKKLNPKLEPESLDIYLVGGASITNNCEFFKIGERNVEAVKTLLKQMGLKLHKEDTGKNISRTVLFKPGEKSVIVKNKFGEKWNL